MWDLIGATNWARATLESDIFFKKPDKWFKIWFFIINRVNHKKNKQFDRGECLTSYLEINSYTGATKNQIDHFIRWSKKEGMLATRKATRGFRVNVLKYNKYQSLSNYKCDTKSDLKAKQKRNKSDTIKKNVKNDKNEKNEKMINIPFSTFWNLYDYKKSKPIAEKKWNSLTDEEREKVIEALPDYVASTNKNGKYPSRKYPTTYLNQEGWEDEIIKGRGIIDYDAMGLTK